MVQRDTSERMNACGAVRAQKASLNVRASSMVLALPAIGSTPTEVMPSQLAAARDMQAWLSKRSLHRAAAFGERLNRESAPTQALDLEHSNGRRQRTHRFGFQIGIHSALRNRTAQLRKQQPRAALRERSRLFGPHKKVHICVVVSTSCRALAGSREI
jgi:hypothetical protein